VVVTGATVVTSAGTGCEAAWAALERGSVASDPDAPRIATVDYEHWVPRKNRKFVIPVTGLAIGAGALALEQSRLDIAGFAPGEVGVFAASAPRHSLGDLAARIARARRLEGRLPLVRSRPWEAYQALCDPMNLLRGMASAPADHLALQYGFRGPTATFTSGGAGAMSALTEAARMIRTGRQRAMVVVASDSHTSELRRLASARTTQGAHGEGTPGTVPADGGAAVVLESETSARHRSAPLVARLDRAAVRMGRPGDLNSALRDCLDAVLHPPRSGRALVLTCANGTSERDRAEREVLDAYLGDGARRYAPAMVLGESGIASALIAVALAVDRLSARREEWALVDGVGDSGGAGAMVLEQAACA
jgi:3-oxoacyl-(acyl-carrier-protein) synthase